LLNLARDLVRYRPNRTEPRAVKRRPKPYPLLNQPRHRFREIPHRNRYWKRHPRNCRSLNSARVQKLILIFEGTEGVVPLREDGMSLEADVAHLTV